MNENSRGQIKLVTGGDSGFGRITAIELAIFDREIAARVNTSLANNEALLAGLVREGHLDRSVSRAVDPEQTARVTVCLTQGMRVVGKAGRAPPDPSVAIDIAMKLLT